MQKLMDRPRGISAGLANALDRHFVACAAAATAAVVAGHADQSQAAIIYSGAQNLALGYGSTGQLYINLETKAVASGRNPVPGWDVNPFVNSPNFFIYTPVKNELVRAASAPANSGDIAKLTAGTTTSSSSNFVNYTGGFMNNNSVGDWTGAGTGYVGFKISHAGINSGNPVFGWMQVSKAASGTPTSDPTGITIIDWAYEDTGAAIAAGATGVPEPTSLALLAAGAMGLLVRRSRAASAS